MYSASKFYFLSALSNSDYHDIKNFLEEGISLHDVNNLNQTYLLQFLYTKKKLNITDIKIILLFLRYDSEIDRVDFYNETARKKLLTFGYIVEGKYLKITEEFSKFHLVPDMNNLEDEYMINLEDEDMITKENEYIITKEDEDMIKKDKEDMVFMMFS